MRQPSRVARIVVALVLTASVGCAARQIREAQDAFNEASRAENAQRASTLSGHSPLQDSSAAAAGYRIAVNLLDAELEHHGGKLREEKLYGTALVLKAMSQWRLADLDDDPEAARGLQATLDLIEREKGSGTLTLGTRDEVMVAALPGLRDHDLGLRETDPEQAGSFFDSAVTVMEAALSQGRLPADHPVRIYMRLSQLASLRSWQALIFRHVPQEERAPQVKRIHDRARKIVEDLESATRLDPALRSLVQQYKTAIGIS